jgi:hypothetical protein
VGSRVVGESWKSRGRVVGETWESRGRVVGASWAVVRREAQMTIYGIMRHRRRCRPTGRPAPVEYTKKNWEGHPRQLVRHRIYRREREPRARSRDSSDDAATPCGRPLQRRHVTDACPSAWTTRRGFSESLPEGPHSRGRHTTPSDYSVASPTDPTRKTPLPAVGGLASGQDCTYFL